MKKELIRTVLVAAAIFAMPTIMYAQLGNLAKKAKAAAATAKSLNSDANLIGEEELTADAVKGTWSYREPGIAFGPGNAAAKAAGNAAAEKVEPVIKEGLTKAGFKPGMLKFTFNNSKEDGQTAKVVVASKEFEGTYALEGATIAVTLNETGKTFKFNGKLDGGRLQLALTPSDMLDFVKAAAPQADNYAAQVKSVSDVLDKVKILYLALTFGK